MASMEPSPAEVSQLVEITGLDYNNDRAMIVQALKSNNLNAETVVMHYFDDPEAFRRKYNTAWDDTMFTADRDGNDNNTGISFHVESLNQNDVIQGVTPPPEKYGHAALSRPPSRSNDRSPLGAANQTSQEDDDMQRALRESAQEAGISMPEQESGVINASTPAPHFGPANRTDYDQGDWAMVPLGTSGSKLAGAPRPTARKRAPGTPAFLVQGHTQAGNHRLGGLLTILHEVPLARNVLLEAGSPAPSYGFNSEWWNGQEILPPHVLAQLQTGELTWGQQDVAKPEFEEEIHRLMAFLDSTDRSYGSTSVLTDLIPYSSLAPEKQFYEHLGDKAGDKLKPLNHVASLALVQGDDLGDEEAKFGLLEMEHPRTEYAHIKTLYESLDNIMWNDSLAWNEVHAGAKMAVFKEMGEVLVIKIGGEGPEESIDIPEELYPERYLASRKEEARRIQVAMCELKSATTKIAQDEQSINEWVNDWNHRSYDKKGMIGRATSQWKTYSKYLEGLGRFRGMEESGFDTDEYPDYRAAPSRLSEAEQEHYRQVEGVLQLTERMLSDIDGQMKALGAQLEQIKAKQRFLGRLLTDPNKAGRPQRMMCKKYLLRGVTSRPDVVYVCQRLEPDLVDVGEAPKQLDQWWRLAYVPDEAEPVKSEKVEVERVLRDVWEETKTPMLVYATEESLNTPRTSLSVPLDRFVRADNKAFRQELNKETAPEDDAARKAAAIDPISPSKRKHRADSVDSMDSNRASIGSDGEDVPEDPFADPEDEIGAQVIDAAIDHSEMAGATGPEVTRSQVDGPSELDNRQPAHTENTSATLTPTTMKAEHVSPVAIEGDRELVAVGGSITMKTNTGVAKGPEMQERSRPPAFVAVSPPQTDSAKRANSMDMDIADHPE